MFESTIEKDFEFVSNKDDLELMCNQIFQKYRKEFLEFIEEIKNNGIVDALYNSSTPEETISIWEKYSSANQDFIDNVKYWAEARVEYFNTHECFPLFEVDEKIDSILEIGLLIIIVKDESLLSSEDIDGFDEKCGIEFDTKLVELLEKSSNPILKAAACYIDCDGYDTITQENIFDFYYED